MKSIYDLDLDGLEKRKKFTFKMNLITLVFGAFYVGLGMFYYIYADGDAVFSLMIFIYGISFLILGSIPNNIGLLIYFKKKGM